MGPDEAIRGRGKPRRTRIATSTIPEGASRPPAVSLALQRIPASRIADAALAPVLAAPPGPAGRAPAPSGQTARSPRTPPWASMAAPTRQGRQSHDRERGEREPQPPSQQVRPRPEDRKTESGPDNAAAPARPSERASEKPPIGMLPLRPATRPGRCVLRCHRRQRREEQVPWPLPA